jgi:hypothetical protein
MSTIFISYRREDTIGLTGRIFDRLKVHFGLDSIMMDIDSIPYGADFREYIANAIDQCSVMLVVIGDKWFGTGNDGNSRRIDDVRDFVRLELETALNSNLTLIPVLIGSRPMPTEEELPQTIKSFAYKNAIQIDPGRDFHHHMDRLIQTLEPLTGAHKTKADPLTKLPAAPELPGFAGALERVTESQRGTRPPLLELVSGPLRGQFYELAKDRVLVGRGSDNDIVLNDPFMNRYHAQFVRLADGYAFEDLGSSNGSYLNGISTTGRTPLKTGDRIHVGQSILRYYTNAGVKTDEAPQVD